MNVDGFDELWHEVGKPAALLSAGRVVAKEEPWGIALSLEQSGGICGRETPGWDTDDPFCHQPAGKGTWHTGAGKCSKHGGNSRRGSLEGWLIMVHKFAQFQGVTPWEALLEEVERTAAGLRFLDEKVGQATHDEDLLPDGEFGPWVTMRERLQAHGLRVFKATMDVGIERIMAEQSRIDGERMAQVLLAGIEAGNLTDEQRVAVTGAMRRALEAQDDQSRVKAEIEGIGTQTRGRRG